ncbi:outer membrane beta-barrel protein [Verrucomicrobiaceae bacterium N1E253]|uniref:Outer membrane beta-barrel protein n=1 Tax=Oceaniferula marina TaxID=2748318 RepID=A0A851GJ10_9BACT|nr:outer membrane beta-barrel protein [Oceaniferula marina]NWK56962.1 outer membrane beta-barrel protein [Oceaniferula marina]
MNMFYKTIATCVISSLISTAGALQAQDDSKNASIIVPDPVAAEDTWEYNIAPYLWLSGIEGQAGVKNVVTDIDLPLDDIIDLLDFAGYLSFKANKGNWGYYADMQYIKLKGEQEGPGGPLINKVNIGLEQFRMELGAKYRIYHNDKTTIRLMAGLQYTYFYTELETKGKLTQDVDGSTDWIDPTIGISLTHQFNEKWNAHVVGQVGGFGVSADSTWQVLAGIGYQLNDCWRLVGGYRHQYLDYSDGGFLYDLDIGGPVLGAVYTF